MEQKLLKMKQEIDEAKAKKNRLEGEMDGIKSSLKEKYGFDSIEDAEKEIDSLEKDIEAKEADFKDQMEKLAESYEWETV